jgi:hypothetical protein
MVPHPWILDPCHHRTHPPTHPHPTHRCAEPKLAQVQLPRLQRCAEGPQLLVELGAVCQSHQVSCSPLPFWKELG